MRLRRLIQLFAGLTLYGLAVALMIRADIGLNPWEVLHQGVSRRAGIGYGTSIFVVGAIVMLLWIPLRQRPGIGTICDVLVVGTAAELFLLLFPPLDLLPVRYAVFLLGLLLCGFSGAAYLGAGFGPGPRDGLMTGLANRTGWRLRRVRTGIELAVLSAGFLLGGTAGVGTLLFALGIGPIVQGFLPIFKVAPAPVGFGGIGGSEGNVHLNGHRG